MLQYFIKRLLLALPIALGVSVVCFSLVHIAPGDPLASIIPAEAPQELQLQLRAEYGLDRPLPVQFALWLWRGLHGDLGLSIATGRPVAPEVAGAVANTVMIALLAAAIGFVLGGVLGFVAGCFHGGAIDRLASGVAVLGVSVPHYWLGIVLVIVFSVELNWLPATGAGPGGSAAWAWDWEHLRFAVLPALTMAAIPMGIVARSLRALVADTLSQEFVEALRAKGLAGARILVHVVKNVAPTALAVMGLQLGYLLGGSILIETVFSWPGTGFLLGDAILKRDLPVLQGTILVLAMFFVALNLLVDLIQTWLDPRIKRA
jgi:peptide/nickel transport system permease protein